MNVPRPSRLQPLPQNLHGSTDIRPPLVDEPDMMLPFSLARDSLRSDGGGSTASFPIGGMLPSSSYFSPMFSSFQGIPNPAGGRSKTTSLDVLPPHAAGEDLELGGRGGGGRRRRTGSRKKSKTNGEYDPTSERGSESQNLPLPYSDDHPIRRSKSKGKSVENKGKNVASGCPPANIRSTTTVDNAKEVRGIKEARKEPKAVVKHRKDGVDEYRQMTEGRGRNTPFMPDKGMERISFSDLTESSKKRRNPPKDSEGSVSNPTKNTTNRFSAPSYAPPSTTISLSPGEMHTSSSQSYSASVTPTRQRRTRSKTKEKGKQEGAIRLGEGTSGYLLNQSKTTTSTSLVGGKQVPPTKPSSGSSSKTAPFSSSPSAYPTDGDVRPTVARRAGQTLPGGTAPVVSPQPPSITGSANVVSTSFSAALEGRGTEVGNGRSAIKEENRATIAGKEKRKSAVPSSSAESKAEDVYLTTESLRSEVHRRSNAIMSNVAGNLRAKPRRPPDRSGDGSVASPKAAMATAMHSPSFSVGGKGSSSPKTNGMGGGVASRKKSLFSTADRQRKGRPNDAEMEKDVAENGLPEAPALSHANPATWAAHLSTAVVKVLAGREVEPPFTTHLWKQAYAHPEDEMDAEDVYDEYAERPMEPGKEDGALHHCPAATTSSTRSSSGGVLGSSSPKKESTYLHPTQKPLSNPHMHQYDRKLHIGYYACIRCHAPIFSPKFQVQHEERGVAAFQYLNSDAVRVEVDISSASPLLFASTTSPVQNAPFSSASHSLMGGATSKANSSEARRDDVVEPHKVEPRTRRVDPCRFHMMNTNSQIHCLVFCAFCDGCLGICTLDIPVSMGERVESGELFYANSCCLVYQPYRTNANFKRTIMDDFVDLDDNNVRHRPSPLFTRTDVAHKVIPTTNHSRSSSEILENYWDGLKIVEDDDFTMRMEDFDSDDGECARRPVIEFPSEDNEFGLLGSKVAL